MESSEKINSLAKALFTFHKEMGKIAKTSSNPFFKSKYADLPTILDAISEPLHNAGLVIVSIPDGEGLTSILMHSESGEYISANATMKPVKNDPQSIGSAITYQRRYSIGSMLNLNIDNDDDGKAASKPAKVKDNSEKPALLVGSEQWTKAIDYLKNGGVITNIKARYEISPANEKQLLILSKND